MQSFQLDIFTFSQLANNTSCSCQSWMFFGKSDREPCFDHHSLQLLAFLHFLKRPTACAWPSSQGLVSKKHERVGERIRRQDLCCLDYSWIYLVVQIETQNKCELKIKMFTLEIWLWSTHHGINRNDWHIMISIEMKIWWRIFSFPFQRQMLYCLAKVWKYCEL